jgi:hypothetical protein
MNVKRVVIVAALAFVPVGLAVYWWMHRQKEGAERDRAERDRLERLVQEDRQQKEKEAAQTGRRTEELLAVVRPLLPQCPPDPYPRDVRVRGKVWVWDETSRSASGANQKLSADIRGEPGDADLTVFVITNSSKVQVATYYGTLLGGKESPGYRRDLEVCAIDPVTKRPLGKVTVEGSDPPREVKRPLGSDPVPVYGETDEALARWIAWRPRLGRPDRVGDALLLVPECRRLGAAAAPRVRSRVLVWDLAPYLPDRANERLPDGRRGRPEDADLTVVVVTGRRLQFLTDTEAMHLSQEKLEVCLIDAARNKAVGTTTVDGALYEAPRDEANKKEQGVFDLHANWVGDRDEALAKWVAGLPREAAP